MNGRLAKKVRREAHNQARINAGEAWGLVREAINRQKLGMRIRTAWRVVRGKL